MPAINLDHNATTPLLPEVAEALERAYRAGYANPASQHAEGRRAHAVVEQAREAIAAMLGADLSRQGGDRLIFTSGGTESNHLAILGTAACRPAGHLVVSPIEHPSVLGPIGILASRGWQVESLPVAGDGAVQPAVAAALTAGGGTRSDAGARPLRAAVVPAPAGQAIAAPVPTQAPASPALVCLMLANHETGVLQPVAQVAAACQERGVPLHTDAVQAVGKHPVHFRELGATTLAFAAHKFHGPVGIGGLLVRGGAPLAPIMQGGFQQFGLRPGTESAPLVIGLQVALAAALRDAKERRAHLATLRDRFESAILATYPAVIQGRTAERLPHVSNLAFVGLDRRQLAMALDLADVACSTGSACASGSSEPSPVLQAMQCDRQIVDSALRFSFGVENTMTEVDEAIRRVLRVVEQLAPGQG